MSVSMEMLLPWQPMVEFLGTPSEINGGPLGYPQAKLYALCQYVTISPKMDISNPTNWPYSKVLIYVMLLNNRIIYFS